MKRVAIVLALAAIAVLAIGELGDLTQSRPDPIRTDAVTALVFGVEEDRFAPGEEAAAEALWTVCAAQTASAPTPAGLVAIGESRYRVLLRPAVGHHERKKLVGCLEDLTIDRVLGDVESFRTLSIPDPSSE